MVAVVLKNVGLPLVHILIPNDVFLVMRHEAMRARWLVGASAVIVGRWDW